MIGTVVKSKMGRDKGKFYIVTNIIDEYFIHVADGRKKLYEKPKRKSKKHIEVVDCEKLILLNEISADDKIKKHLDCHVKEV